VAGIYVALGTNLGDRLANLRRAHELLRGEAEIEAVSSVYRSVPQPPAPPPPYYNAAARIATTLSPEGLLRRLQDIERRMGRRPAERWSPRVIDLDLVLYGDVVIDTPPLTVPHARMLERAFVLRPLLDIDPELVHPLTRAPLANALAGLVEDLNLVDRGQ
jgi:2-amino-4-hydroxy-6-hydroxymethyldihydropteridine diphosphokinase